MNNFDRIEDKYIDRMTVLIARGRLVVKTSTEILNALQRETEDHIHMIRKSNRNGDSDGGNNNETTIP